MVLIFLQNSKFTNINVIREILYSTLYFASPVLSHVQSHYFIVNSFHFPLCWIFWFFLYLFQKLYSILKIYIHKPTKPILLENV